MEKIVKEGKKEEKRKGRRKERAGRNIREKKERNKRKGERQEREGIVGGRARGVRGKRGRYWCRENE